MANAWIEVNQQVLVKLRNNRSWDRNIKSRTALGCNGQNPRIVTFGVTREESSRSLCKFFVSWRLHRRMIRKTQLPGRT